SRLERGLEHHLDDPVATRCRRILDEEWRLVILDPALVIAEDDVIQKIVELFARHAVGIVGSLEARRRRVGRNKHELAHTGAAVAGPSSETEGSTPADLISAGGSRT